MKREPGLRKSDYEVEDDSTTRASQNAWSKVEEGGRHGRRGMCQKAERRSHLNQSKLRCGPLETRNRGPTGVSSSIGLGLPGLMSNSSKKATVEGVGPTIGNGPTSACIGLSRSPNEPKGSSLCPIREGFNDLSNKGEMKRIGSGPFEDPTWVCARGPSMVPQEVGVGQVGSLRQDN